MRCIKERGLTLAEPLRVMATRARKEEDFGGEACVEVCETCGPMFDGLDVVFFAGREGAKGASVQWREAVQHAGAIGIDNGSDFRLDPDVPLVVPEVNMDAVTENTKFIASPNCSTIQMVVALAPLHRAVGIKRIVVSTYQAVSGWGQAAVEEMERQLPQYCAGDCPDFDPSVFSRPIALDCIPHIDRFTESGYTKEELKIRNETRKILGVPEMKITATAVRVPVAIGHSEAINIELEKPLTAAEALDILRDPALSPGVVVVDGPACDPNATECRKAPEERQYPTQRDILQDEWKDMVLVGRVREDDTIENGLNLWVVADNLRKGAATNVVQIAQKMIERGLLG